MPQYKKAAEKQTWENLISIPQAMSPITQPLPCRTMDYIYTQTAHRGSRDAMGRTGS